MCEHLLKYSLQVCAHMFLGVRSYMSYKYLYFSRGLNSHTLTCNIHVCMVTCAHKYTVDQKRRTLYIYIYINICVCPQSQLRTFWTGTLPPLNKNTTWVIVGCLNTLIRYLQRQHINIAIMLGWAHIVRYTSRFLYLDKYIYICVCIHVYSA